MVDVFAEEFNLFDALQSDAGVKDIETALETALAQLRRKIDQGLAPADFKAAEQVREGLMAAKDALSRISMMVRLANR